MPNVRIIILNSLRNKNVEHKNIKLLQARGFYENGDAVFAFCDAILDINSISYKKQYTMDE